MALLGLRLLGRASARLCSCPLPSRAAVTSPRPQQLAASRLAQASFPPLASQPRPEAVTGPLQHQQQHIQHGVPRLAQASYPPLASQPRPAAVTGFPAALRLAQAS